MVDGIFSIINGLKRLVATFLGSSDKKVDDVAAVGLSGFAKAAGVQNKSADAVVEPFKYVSRHLDSAAGAVLLENYICASNDEKNNLRCSATPLQDIGPHHLT